WSRTGGPVCAGARGWGWGRGGGGLRAGAATGAAGLRAGAESGATGSPGRGRAGSPSTLTVTLRSPLEADMARRSLIPDAQRHQHGIQREFTVNGSALAIRWTAADLALFRSSINSSLDQLCLVIRNIRRFVYSLVSQFLFS
uniref:L antigen family member 3 n=1 Tax=Sus scrofa TaxID=9823 RepID=A0A8D1AN59_PIG